MLKQVGDEYLYLRTVLTVAYVQIYGERQREDTDAGAEVATNMPPPLRRRYRLDLFTAPSSAVSRRARPTLLKYQYHAAYFHAFMRSCSLCVNRTHICYLYIFPMFRHVLSIQWEKKKKLIVTSEYYVFNIHQHLIAADVNTTGRD